MIEFKIWLPPINQRSKPWQHAFDKFSRKAKGDMKNNHDLLKLYWERSGKPQLYFKYGDDPWLAVLGTPSFNPAFEYRLNSKGEKKFDVFKTLFDYEGEIPLCAQPDVNSYDYKRGYKQALDDVRAETERLQAAKRCQLKSST